MFFEQIFEEKLAQYAYVIGCQKSGEAIVIDPMRDIQRYEELAAKNNLKIVAAADTHIHADYISGLREFAEKGVKVYVSDEGDADWKYEWAINSDYNYQLLKDGDEFKIGNIIFKAVYSPGHTPEHLSYLVTDGATTTEPMGICSGDFVFVGDVGRPDLLETAAGQAGVMEGSAKVLYKSLGRFNELPDYLQVWPGHGAGSACGKALGAVPDSTVGYEKRFNNSIKAATSEQDFVNFILDGQPEPPMYFARMKRDNKIGPNVLGEMPSPTKLTVAEIVEKSNADNAVLVDSRDRETYVSGHLKGSLFAPMAKEFNTVVGSYVTEDQDIYLVVEEDKVDEAVVDLIRIGLDNVKGYITPQDLEGYSDLVETPVLKIDDVMKLVATGDYHILDVRKKTEYDLGHHPDAINIAHTRLLARIDEVPTDKPLIVHCQTGVRSSYAAGLLNSKGFEVLLVVDDVAPWLAKEHLLAGAE